MRAALVVLAGLLVLGLGWGWHVATRPAVPPVPAAPADWTDPPLAALVAETRAAVAANPRDPTAWGRLGFVFQIHNGAEQAATCFATAAALDPADGRWPFRQATLASAANPEAAAGLLRTALAAHLPSPAHVTYVRLLLADTLVELGRADEATALLREVRAADPGNYRAAYRLAELAISRGDDAAAVPLLLDLAREPYFQQRAAAAVAGIHRRRGNSKDAAGFEYAASLLPPDREWPNPFAAEAADLARGRHALVEEATRRERDGDAAGAVAVADRLTRQYPGPASQVLLGRMLVTAGRNDEAAGVLADALRADPGQATAHAFLGIAVFQEGERAEAAGDRAAADASYRRAAAVFATAAELGSDHVVGYLYQAKTLLKLGRAAEAVGAARAFLDRRPEQIDGHLALAEALLAAGRPADGRAAAERAAKLARPGDPRPARLLARMPAG